MKILAVDTSAFPASVAVSEGGVILGEFIVRSNHKHSRNLMVMIQELLEELETDIMDVDLFAITTGPGSFTGLRIGIAAVRAFAQASKKRVIGVNTLEALAYNFAGTESVVVPMIDARREEVFTAAYEFNGNNIKEIIGPSVMTVNDIASRFAEKTVIYTGDGMIKHKQEITRNNAVFAAANLSEVRASSIAALAQLKYDDGFVANYNEIKPLYLRKSQAEQEYDKRRGNNDSNRQ